MVVVVELGGWHSDVGSSLEDMSSDCTPAPSSIHVKENTLSLYNVDTNNVIKSHIIYIIYI